MKAGDLLSIRLPGSGGYGPPTERPAEKVRWDVLNGKISLESAMEHYRVAFHSDLTIDETKTSEMRKKET